MRLDNYLIYNTEKRRFLHGSITVENGIITDIEYSGKDIKKGKKIIPGLIDVHTHGRAGIDIMTAGTDELIALGHSYASLGTTTVFPTVMTAEYDSITSAVKSIKEASRHTFSDFAGIHAEGPYISKKRPGCHKTALIRKPDTEEMVSLAKMISPLLSHFTVAPEEDGCMDAVKVLSQLGSTVGIGHSDADLNTCTEALSAGAVSFTHTYNAMSPLSHREPGCVGASLSSDAYSEFIVDGFHLSPAVVNISYKVKTNSRFVLITDSVAAAGMPDGKYTLADMPVNVKDGKITTDDGTIAGSCLDMVTAVKNLMKFTFSTLEEVLPCATENPAKQVGIYSSRGSLEKGKRADLVILGENGEFEIENVSVFGKFLY